MKKPIRLAIISVSLVAASHAAPFMAIGDGAELFLTGSLGVRADDNVTLSGNAESDLIFDITPGIDLTFGKGSQLTGSLTLVHAFSNYTDNSRLNTNLFSGDFVSRYDDGKMKLGFNVSFHELSQNTADVRPTGPVPSLTRRDIFSTGGNAEVEISQLTSIGGGVSFQHENYKPVGYADADTLTIPIDLYYKWTPKIDLSAGYRYRSYETDIGSDSTDHYFNVGGRGEFTPKLTGRFTVGLGTRDLDKGGDKSLLGLDASLNYELTPKTNLQVGASNDFGTSPQGAQQENFTINGMITSKISEEWSVNGGLSWRSIDYGTRTDGYFEGTLGTTYIISNNVRIIGGYTYRNYSSDLSGSEFKNNVFSVSASFRY